MNKYSLLIIIGLFLAWSCNSDETDKQQKDDEIVTSDENSGSKENDKATDKVVQEKPKINENFKTFLSNFSKVSLPYKENPDGTERNLELFEILQTNLAKRAG